ncbi:hypothetical protein PRZ48_005910 [Zasmidium cellare]|uniref:Uncharacterized protein n=1 Tax=Zasmidium cellare TaxID=395010 RepID=A0ABR0EMT8_ZASCE|nr:hypothetical protein PRZ48_005910 [Zasmidium cellare]
MDLAPFRIRFHEAAQPCTSLVTPHDIKTDKYKCAKDHEWQPSDVSKTLCVHVLDDNNRVVSLPQITRYVIDDGDDDEEEEDEDDEDEEGDEVEDQNRSRKEDSKRGKSDQKKASKRVDDDASDDDDDDDDDGNNDEQPRYLFVAFCPKRHASPLMHLKDAFVRIDRPHCQSIKEVVAKLVKRIREQKDDFAFNLTTDRMRFHRMDDRDCQGDLSFKTLLSDHTVSTMTPDQHLWGKKVVQLHVERQGQSSAESNKAAKPTSSIGKPGSSRAPSKPLGDGDASSSGRGARHEDGNHSTAEGNDSGGGGQGSSSEERSRYLVFVSCPQVHSWLSLKLKKTWVKVDPPFVGWGQNGVLGELRRSVGGSDLPTLPTGDSAILSIHPSDQCQNQLTLQQALRDYSFQSAAGARVPFDQSKRLFVHFAKPPAGQPPTQGSSTVITSASQSSQNPKKRASPVNTSSKGGVDDEKSGPVAKRPRIPDDEDAREENNNARRLPGTDKANTGDAQKARWLFVHICAQHHRHAPPGVKGAIVLLRIDPASCKNLQDIGSQVAEVIEGQYGSFGYNSAVHDARFFANGDLECVDSLDFKRLLRVHTTISRPADEEIQSGGAKRKTAVKIHFDGDPKVFRNEEQAKGAKRQSSGKAQNRNVDNGDGDGPDDHLEKEETRKRQSNSTSRPPAKRAKVAGCSRSTARKEKDTDTDGALAEDQTEQDAPGDDESNSTNEEDRPESEGGDPEFNDAENSDAESLEAAGVNDDVDIFKAPLSSLDGRAIVRIGVLETPDAARTPNNDALPMRTVVVAMVEKKGRAWPITLISIDYMATLRKAIRTYVRGGRARRDQEASDNDSDRSTSRREGKPVPNRPQRPVKAPLRPRPTRKHKLQEEWDDGLSTYYDNWNPGDRIDAVICFVNTSAKTELETHRNFQASMPPTQSLTAFRRYIKNTRFNNTKGTLKHILRDVGLDWWCDFQVSV